MEKDKCELTLRRIFSYINTSTWLDLPARNNSLHLLTLCFKSAQILGLCRPDLQISLHVNRPRLRLPELDIVAPIGHGSPTAPRPTRERGHETGDGIQAARLLVFERKRAVIGVLGPWRVEGGVVRVAVQPGVEGGDEAALPKSAKEHAEGEQAGGDEIHARFNHDPYG